MVCSLSILLSLSKSIMVFSERKIINDGFTRQVWLTITSKVKGQQSVNGQTYTT